eukprot:scaffold184903_cov30-Tisochrysis_lutea.AAC.1
MAPHPPKQLPSDIGAHRDEAQICLCKAGESFSFVNHAVRREEAEELRRVFDNTNERLPYSDNELAFLGRDIVCTFVCVCVVRTGLFIISIRRHYDSYGILNAGMILVPPRKKLSTTPTPRSRTKHQQKSPSEQPHVVESSEQTRTRARHAKHKETQLSLNPLLLLLFGLSGCAWEREHHNPAIRALIIAARLDPGGARPHTRRSSVPSLGEQPRARKSHRTPLHVRARSLSTHRAHGSARPPILTGEIAARGADWSRPRAGAHGRRAASGRPSLGPGAQLCVHRTS